jgi:hypothetical protein
MEKIWHYLDNQFVNIGERSFKKALIISNYHDAVLETAATNPPTPDPDMVFMYNRYHPLHEDLLAAYSDWQSKGGTQEGATLDLDQLLGLMTAKLDNWDARVQVVHAKNTGRYRTIFKDGRTPFRQGGKDARIEAVQSLSKAIGDEAPLATIKTEVDAYYAQLVDARKLQSGAKALTKSMSSGLEEAILAAMKMQYRNLGFLMNKEENPDAIAIFFDTATIRERDQRIYTGTLDPLENEAVLIHTFMADDEIRLKADGNAPVKFYLGTTPNNTDGNGITVEANQEITIPAKEFNPIDYATHRYLTAVNQTDNTTTKYLVELY